MPFVGANPVLGQSPAPSFSCSGDLGLASQFNLFVRGSLNYQNSSAQGRVAGGGNVTLRSYQVGSSLSNSNGTRDDLIGGGDVDFQNGQVPNGNLIYGNNLVPPGPALGSGNQALQGTPIAFDAEFTSLVALSARLGAIPPNGQTTFDGGLTLTGSDPLVNIFAVSGADMARAYSMRISVPAGATAIVNVDGSVTTMQNMSITLNGTDTAHVLYNFFQASGVTFETTSPQRSATSAASPCRGRCWRLRPVWSLATARLWER